MAVQHIHGGDIFGASAALGIDENYILDFSANINPLGPPPGVYEAIAESLHLVRHYPDPFCRELKNELARYLKVDPEQLVMGNGASELIYLLVKVLRCSKALIPVPTFTEYKLAVVTAGGMARELPLRPEDDYQLDIDSLTDELSGGEIVFVCNPNNPTGNLHPKPILMRLLEKVEAAGAYLVVDEAFIDFVNGASDYTVVPLVVENSSLIVLYSLTKFFAIPGLRLGAAIASRDLVEAMTAAKDPWNVNVFAQAAGAAALRDVQHMHKTRQLVNKEKEYLFQKLRLLPGVKPRLGAANYLFVNIKETGLTSQELADLLGLRGILVRDCSSFSGLDAYHIRVAVKTRVENKTLLDTLAEVLEEAGV